MTVVLYLKQVPVAVEMVVGQVRNLVVMIYHQRKREKLMLAMTMMIRVIPGCSS